MARRVVVTGLGLLCPLGTSVKQSWTRLIAGDSGIVSLLSHPSTAALRDEYSTLPSTVAGVVQDNNWLEMLSRDDQRKMSRFAQMAVAASEEALRDSGLNVQKMSVTERERMVSSLNGLSLGSLLRIRNWGIRRRCDNYTGLFQRGIIMIF